MEKCENCQNYWGDCGHHPKDENGHILYDRVDIMGSAYLKDNDRSYSILKSPCMYYMDNRSDVDAMIDYIQDSNYDIKGCSEQLINMLRNYDKLRKEKENEK